MNALLITSRPPCHSAGLGKDVVGAIMSLGLQVDVLSLYGQENQPDNMVNIIPFKKSYKEKAISFLQRISIFRKLWHLIRRVSGVNGSLEYHYIRNNGISIVYPFEQIPDVPIQQVLSHINKDYDFVISLFWQDFINSKTLKAIYDKLKCPILIYSVDMAPFTGGCYYFNHCRNFEAGCGICPGLASISKDDQSHKNFEIKKYNYSQMECYFLGNTWMNNFAKRSNIFAENQIRFASIVLNENEFSPIGKKSDKVDLPKRKKFGILYRAMPNLDARKGDTDFDRMMQLLYDRLEPKERKCIVVLPVGCYLKEDRKQKIKFDVMDIGRVSSDKLKNLYRVSSVFVSPSNDDAGPSMVNQAMMCGTPVLAFNIGTAIDMIEDGVNGYKSEIGDVEHLVNGLVTLIRSNDTLNLMGERARKKALAMNSYKAFAKNIVAILRSSSLNNKIDLANICNDL